MTIYPNICHTCPGDYLGTLNTGQAHQTYCGQTTTIQIPSVYHNILNAIL